MKPQTDYAPSSSTPFDGAAAALVDEVGRIVWWSRAAAELLGRSEEEAVGRSALDFLAAPVPRTALRPGAPARRTRLRHRSGALLEVELQVLPGTPWSLVIAVPTGLPAVWTGDAALARALFEQDRIPVAEFDTGLRLIRTNRAFELLRPEGAPDDWPTDLASSGEGTVKDAIARIVDGGTSTAGAEYLWRSAGSKRILPLTCFAIRDSLGALTGVAVAVTEATDRRRDRGRADADRSGAEVGSSLDVVHNARDLVEALVPALGDLVAVDFPDDVLQGRDPPLGYPGMEASAPRRVAVKSADGVWPRAMVQLGEAIPQVTDQAASAAIAVGRAFEVDPDTGRQLLAHDPELLALLMPEGMRSALVCPLYHRSRLYGSVLLWRTSNPAPFDDTDLKLLQDLCDRTAIGLDHAFSYTREHKTAIALQRSLLPPTATESTACETAGTYLPADGNLSVGGDWFDAIAMSSLRVGLVIGDVIGHGLQATATMARLRTAVQTLADLDIPPDELLTHLDDLVQRMAGEADQPDTVGATCLFAVYDPVNQECQLASAGHPPPALITPGGEAEYLELTPGPSLGVGDNPFEITTVTLPPGSLLALYTDGLTGRDPAAGMARLLGDLDRANRPGRPLEEVGAELTGLLPADADHPGDDATLLLARTRAIVGSDTAVWEYPPDLAAVQTARNDANAQLERWGLQDQMFATELIVSELVTNAIRHTGGPAVLRLIRERILVCEVSDQSNTQPRLRRALNTDEGGRGLYIIAQLTSRWGSRYSARGKTIWTEQPLT
ncbi:SpoIIE family protein phosphatase [Streptacidiphilus sp. P02-A3a]|uniref:ATP-binding SpoIIE family protein phosphatase n=1 Tax=Streptacidiphilus sp. P02-A3a TaxID=2704468 RepID=UPI0015F8E060|nr:SpoIIE family protein phosphatase [Streptacidiphilus sp. P02-A3a]QMU69664.1 SpoIIE family protein phosphatase [Streptacidiphilus sp. P02-A3a]